jgi:hypothetical protein
MRNAALMREIVRNAVVIVRDALARAIRGGGDGGFPLAARNNLDA